MYAKSLQKIHCEIPTSCNTSTVDHFPHGIYFIMLGSRMHRKDIQGIVRLSK